MTARLQRFAAAGLAATLLYACLATLFDLAGLGATPASSLAYVLSACFSYAAQRLAFASQRRHGQAAPRFAAMAALGLAVASLLPMLASALGLPAVIGVAMVCVVVPAMNFVLLDRLVFGRLPE